ncbi:MarR family transcriptional regulator [Laceyella putida]|uniref:MarR family transcriptional regulator n=1 Tax=Laceyella putida TaxID=110101 RepID=A0ABW2RR52_9BACL
METLIHKFPELDCSPLQFCILELLYTEEVNEWTQSELAEFFGVTRETINKNMKLLEERGWVERVTLGKRQLYFLRFELGDKREP